jgi:Integrase core domain
VTGWGWFYLSTILDDFSRYIIAWKLCTTMKAEDVTDTLKLALQASGLHQATVMHRPRLLSDNGSSYVSGDLARWLERQDMRHTRGAPYHPMTQRKIERWHQTLKNRILLENYYLPGDLEAQIDAFVAYYNHRRYHQSIDNLTRPTSTSGAVKPSCWKEKGSNARSSKTVGCFTTNKPRNINHDAPDSLLVQAASCLKIPDDGQPPWRPLDGGRHDGSGQGLPPFESLPTPPNPQSGAYRSRGCARHQGD